MMKIDATNSTGYFPRGASVEDLGFCLQWAWWTRWGKGPSAQPQRPKTYPRLHARLSASTLVFFFSQRRMHWKGELMTDGILMLQKALDCRFVGEECGWVVLEVPFRSAPLGLCPLRRSLGFRTARFNRSLSRLHYPFGCRATCKQHLAMPANTTITPKMVPYVAHMHTNDAFPFPQSETPIYCQTPSTNFYAPISLQTEAPRLFPRIQKIRLPNKQTNRTVKRSISPKPLHATPRLAFPSLGTRPDVTKVRNEVPRRGGGEAVDLKAMHDDQIFSCIRQADVQVLGTVELGSGDKHVRIRSGGS